MSDYYYQSRSYRWPQMSENGRVRFNPFTITQKALNISAFCVKWAVRDHSRTPCTYYDII